MKLKWQWFLGGRKMFWTSIILFIILIIGFTFTYLIDLTTSLNLKIQNMDVSSIKQFSEEYITSLRYKNR